MPTTYYVHLDGNDTNPGTTPDQPWRSLERVSTARYGAGDRILLAGGQTFRGSLVWQQENCEAATADAPISLGSYGEGRATIEADGGPGVYIENCGGIEVADLVVTGNQSGLHSGIAFYTDLPGDAKLEHLRIDNTEVHGFGDSGISIGASNGLTGYRDVRLTRNVVRGNLRAGISVWGYFASDLIGHAHADFYIAHNTAHSNPGDADFLDNHSGNGIVIGGVDGALMEHNVAYNNGGDNVNRGGGPVGIWAWDCNDVTIQHNEAWGNRTGNTADGGGFDLDGGCTNSVMQHNYSHDNDGAGYLMGQFEGSRPMRNNIIRHNVSFNDGRNNGYGGIHLFRLDGLFEGAEIHDNVVIMQPAAVGQPAAFKSYNDDIHGVDVYSNTFITTDGARLIDLTPGNDITFRDNAYRTSGGQFAAFDGERGYESLDGWRAAANE